MIWFEALWRLVSLLTDAGSAGLLLGGAAAGVLLLAAIAAVVSIARRAALPDARITRRALRERTARTGVPRHRDPDAPGRTRPRGPTAAPAAA
jgi:hypothetical protein